MHSAHAGRVWWIRRPDSGYNVGKEEESGYDAARQQKILGNPEEIDLRKPDQRPMAEKGRQHDIRPLGEASINATVKTATEQGITGEVIIGKVRPRASEKSG